MRICEFTLTNNKTPIALQKRVKLNKDSNHMHIARNYRQFIHYSEQKCHFQNCYEGYLVNSLGFFIPLVEQAANGRAIAKHLFLFQNFS